MSALTVGTKTITYNENTALSLYEVIQRKNVSAMFKSVFIHSDGNVCIEEYDGNYALAGGCSKTGFQAVRERIHSELTKNIPLLVKSGYFTDEALNKLKNSHMEVIFYSSPYGHVCDAIYFDDNMNIVDTVMF